VIDFCGIALEHPVINASGTFDAIAARRAFGDAILERFPFSAFVSKTVTLEPREGNPPPRLWEQGAGLVNSIGLPNKGLRGYLEHDLPELAELPVPLIVNVMGSTREEVATLVAAFAERDVVAALELNLSCPNVKTGLDFGVDPAATEGLIAHVRPLTDKTSKIYYTLMYDNSMMADDAAREKDKASRTATFMRAVQNMKTLAEGGKLAPR